MQTQSVNTDRPSIKRGGALARAIYADGGLADRLREARLHNTADRSMSSIGRPAANDDGSRSYRLALGDEPTAKCSECGETDPGYIDADFDECPVKCEYCDDETTLAVWRETAKADADTDTERCPDCHCPADSDGQGVIDDMMWTCPCGCHQPLPAESIRAANTSNHHGTYTARRVPEAHVPHGDHDIHISGEVWVVYCGASELPRREDLRELSSTWRWGDTSIPSHRLALDLVAHATGDDELALEVYEAYCRTVVRRLPEDGWEMDRGDILEAVDELDVVASEVRQ